MKQRINLLPPRPEVKHDYLSFAVVAPVVAGISLLVALYAAWLWYDNTSTQQTLTQLSAQESQLQLQVQQLEAQLGAQTPDPELVALREQLQQKHVQKQQFAVLLASLQTEQQQGFSVGMEALANQIPQQLWLTGFTVGEAHRALKLSGESVAADLVPVYLSALAASPAFRQMQFSFLETERQGAPVTHRFEALGVQGGHND